MKKIDLLNLPLYLTYDDVLLVPNYSEVLPQETNTSTKLTNKITLKIPIIASPMDTVCEQRMAIAIGKLGGLGIIHRNLSLDDQVKQVKAVVKEKLLAATAVGIGSDLNGRLAALVKAGAKAICIDSAHGHSKNVIQATKKIKKDYPQIELISGNVATYEGAKDLFTAGADVVKVGMGPGSICTTRVMSGMGVPQLTAVSEAVRAARECGKQIIADGGIKKSGDIVKALAIGATTVICGSLLAGTNEAPGETILVNGNKYKSYRGMGSVAAMKKGSAARYNQKWENGETSKLIPQGVEGLVCHSGYLKDHIYQLIGGLQAGMGFLGAKNIEELQKKAKFVRISEAGLSESKPHSILKK